MRTTTERSNDTTTDETFITNANHSHGGLTLLNRLHRTLLITAMCLAAPVAALAQSSNTPPSGFVGVLGGLTFASTTSTGVAGNGGIRIAPDVFVIGEVGFMRNVAPTEFTDAIDDLADATQAQLGVPVTLEMSVPELYGFGGVRWNPARGRLSPFVESGVGVGRVTLKLDKAEIQGTDVRDMVEDEIAGDTPSSTGILFVVGGGVNARMSASTSVDVGIRYTRLAVDDPSSINAVMVYGALKFGR